MEERFSYLDRLQLLLNIYSAGNTVLQVSKQDKNLTVLRRATLSCGKKQFLKHTLPGKTRTRAMWQGRSGCHFKHLLIPTSPWVECFRVK